MIIELIFWLSAFVIFSTYFGYPLLLRFLLTVKKKNEYLFFQYDELPEVTLIIACYNEGDILEEKIQNTLQLDYPEGKLTPVSDSKPEFKEGLSWLFKKMDDVALHKRIMFNNSTKQMVEVVDPQHALRALWTTFSNITKNISTSKLPCMTSSLLSPSAINPNYKSGKPHSNMINFQQPSPTVFPPCKTFYFCLRKLKTSLLKTKLVSS